MGFISLVAFLLLVAGEIGLILEKRGPLKAWLATRLPKLCSVFSQIVFHTDIFLYSFGKIVTLWKQMDQQIECVLQPGLFHMAFEDPCCLACCVHGAVIMNSTGLQTRLSSEKCSRTGVLFPPRCFPRSPLERGL